MLGIDQRHGHALLFDFGVSGMRGYPSTFFCGFKDMDGDWNHRLYDGFQCVKGVV